ncbi:unnamed protein product [Calypogeia fissa]
MLEPKSHFGSANAADRKIYVVGGQILHKIVFGSEVYDPKQDTWSPMKPVPSLRTGHFVSLVGEELFVHGGFMYGPEYNILAERYWSDPGNERCNNRYGDKKRAESLEIYNPVTDEWRTLKPLRPNGQREREVVSVAKGILHCMTHQAIRV